jgi:sterol desaturase/sphingolipid hydroxylase (fatty acid hydroxylase superfamily)
VIRTHPLLDNFAGPFFAALVLVLLVLEWRFPLRRCPFSWFRRLVRNVAFSGVGFALARVALVPIPILASVWAANHGFGVLHWVPIQMPHWLLIVIGVLLMDYLYWWWHVALHLVPFMWRFHNVHHSDLCMDVSTGVRFHFGEAIMSVPFRVTVVLLLGLDFWALIVFEFLFESTNLFEHSNWRLPIGFERFLNCIIVTPRMHGIHHSIVQRETNSNWGTIFCWWDILHSTLRRDIPQDAITIGVAGYRDESELTLPKLFILPFRAQRPWRLPDGRVPERAAHFVKKLAP